MAYQSNNTPLKNLQQYHPQHPLSGNQGNYFVFVIKSFDNHDSPDRYSASYS